MKTPKKIAPHRITFENPDDLEAVVLAKLGMGNAYIRQHTSGLSDGQIQYRLTKAKSGEGLPKGQGYRSQWRTGESQLVKDVLQVVAPTLRAETQKELPKLFTHPTPQTVKLEEVPQPKRARHPKLRTVEFGDLPEEVRRMGRSQAA